MKASVSARTSWLLVPLVIGLLAPSLIRVCLEVSIGGSSAADSLSRIFTRPFATGDNLLLITAFGLPTFAALSGTCYLAACRLSSERLACLGIGGLLGIFSAMVPMHVRAWVPPYGPGHATEPLELALASFACLGTLGMGLLLGWLVSLAFPHAPGRTAGAAASSTVADRARKSSALIHLSQSVQSRFWKVGFDELTKPEQVFRCIWELETEVNHGGFRGYYLSPSGDTAFAAGDALEAIGAHRAADLVRKANALFPRGRPSRDPGERQAQLQSLPDHAEEQLRALDEELTSHPDELNEPLYDYVVSHSAQIAGLGSAR